MQTISSTANPNEFLKTIIAQAVDESVSDIHINPMKDSFIVRFRQADELFPIYQMQKDFYLQLVNIIKNLSGINSKSDNDPQDGKIYLKVNLKEKSIGINLRISVLPSLFGENIVIRLLVEDKEKLNIENLGFSEKNLDIIKGAKDLGNGGILVAGSTGSGKTTTLYSLLSLFDPLKKSIFTIEDPIEYQIDGYIQSQVKYDGSEQHYNMKFNKWLKGLLRQDPDIIMVGEVREKESASLCLEAANTGQMVFGSIHANDALGVIARLKQLGVQNYLISSGIKFIIYQKLVKKLCPYCHTKKDITYSDFFKKDLNRLVSLDGVENGQIILSVANEDGCEHCKEGYDGITLVTEVLKIDDKISQLIFDNKSEHEIKEYAMANGFISVFEDAIIKSINGIVDISDVLMLKK